MILRQQNISVNKSSTIPHNKNAIWTNTQLTPPAIHSPLPSKSQPQPQPCTIALTEYKYSTLHLCLDLVVGGLHDHLDVAGAHPDGVLDRGHRGDLVVRPVRGKAERKERIGINIKSEKT